MIRFDVVILVLGLFAPGPLGAGGLLLGLDDSLADAIGQEVWKNESGGRREGLLAWNRGERFPSLGIGHFLWFPEGVDPGFTESFPDLLRFYQKEGIDLPPGIDPSRGAPWSHRSDFLRRRSEPLAQDLLGFLARTIPTQVRFLCQRLERALARVQAAVPELARPGIEAKLRRLGADPRGIYALMDYVNFKGEGLNPRERIQGQGWGLLQVLLDMPKDAPDPVLAFSQAAAERLRLRVRLSKGRDQRWERGWVKRVESYPLFSKSMRDLETGASQNPRSP